MPRMVARDIIGLADSLLATTNSLNPAEREKLIAILYTDFRTELVKRLKKKPKDCDELIAKITGITACDPATPACFTDRQTDIFQSLTKTETPKDAKSLIQRLLNDVHSV